MVPRTLVFYFLAVKEVPIMLLEKEERNKELYHIDDDLIYLARRLHSIKRPEDDILPAFS